MEAFLTPFENSHVLRLVATEAPDTRVPTHFIMLIDTSESMDDENRLANVKHSASLVLHFLGPQDRVSIVTFGETAKIHCRALPCDVNQKASIQTTIEHIRTNGCTNLSAGLLAVRDVMNGSTLPHKTGLLLLTDGHANRGISRPEGLQQILNQIHGEFPALSISLVGYGLTHNADLLKDMAQSNQGTYSIVETKEGAASVIGDMLGGLFSCVAQQVVVHVPQGTTIEGAQFSVSTTGQIMIGDMYEGNEKLLILGGLPQDAVIRVEGYELPSLRPIRLECRPGISSSAALGETIALTRFRYTLAALFRELRTMSRDSLRAFTGRIDSFEQEIQVFAVSNSNQAVKEMLLAECISLREATRILMTAPWAHESVMMQTTQHEAFTTTGRGLTQRISVAAAAPPLAPRRRGNGARVHFPSAEEDPAAPAVPLTRAAGLQSPYSSRAQRHVTSLMASLSMGGDEEMEEEASQYAVAQ